MMPGVAKDYISWVEITDTFGTKHHRFNAKSVVRITGKNGTGKTSITNAIKSIFQGGSDPTMIRKGAAKSIVALGMASGATITKTTTRKKDGGVRTELEILDPVGNVMPAPQTFVNRLSDALAVDPGAILKIDASTTPGRTALTNLFLRIVPVAFPPDEIATACTYETAKARPGPIANLTGEKWIGERVIEHAAVAPDKPLDLDGLKKLVEQIKEQRKRVGIQAEDAGATVDTLRGSIDATTEILDYATKIKAAEEERATAEREFNERRRDVEEAKHQALTEHAEALRAAVAEIDAEIDAKIAALNQDRYERKATVANENARTQRITLELVQSELQTIEQESKPILQNLAALIATLRRDAETQQRAAHVREQIEVFTAKSLETSRKYKGLSEVIARLDALKQQKLDTLPIAGLEVTEETGPLIDGIPWQIVNTARRVEVAIQLCALCVGTLSFMLLDGAQDLDTDTRVALEEGIVAADYQLIETIVSDGPLTIEVLPEAA